MNPNDQAMCIVIAANPAPAAQRQPERQPSHAPTAIAATIQHNAGSINRNAAGCCANSTNPATAEHAAGMTASGNIWRSFTGDG